MLREKNVSLELLGFNGLCPEFTRFDVYFWFV
jgi:hypothetical protein